MSEDQTTAIENSWDNSFLKLLWRHLVFALHSFFAKSVCPECLWDSESCWPNVISVLCWGSHTYPQQPKQSFLLFLFHFWAIRQAPAVNQNPTGKQSEKCSLQAASPWKSRNNVEGNNDAERSRDNPVHSPKSRGKLFVHFEGQREMIWFVLLKELIEIHRMSYRGIRAARVVY